MAIEHAGVIVVGGGPAGAAVAIHLRRQGHTVTLLEKAHLPRPKPCGESLSPGATPLLAALGVLDELAAGPHGEKAGFSIFPYADAPFRGVYAARSDDDPTRAVGLSIPRLRLDPVLLNAARREGVSVREGWAVREVSAWDGQQRIVGGQDADGNPFTVRTALLIGADGVHSTVARRLGLSHPSKHLRQLAIVTHMRGVQGIGSYGEMHVSAQGYCGVAPLTEGLANVAIVLPVPPPGTPRAESPQAYPGGIEGFFRAHLNYYPHLAERLRAATIVAGPWTTSGLAGSVRRRVDDGLLLIGDAGGYYDPFTGEGIYRGLRSAVLAAAAADLALTQGTTGATYLRPYARAYLREFAPKRLVEVIIHEVTTRKRLFEHVAKRLRSRPQLANALIGVTGDFVAPYEILSPWYLARLLA